MDGRISLSYNPGNPEILDRNEGCRRSLRQVPHHIYYYYKWFVQSYTAFIRDRDFHVVEAVRRENRNPVAVVVAAKWPLPFRNVQT